MAVGPLERRDLGTTGIAVSAVGLGTVKFGRTEQLKYPTPFELPSDAEVATILDVAKTCGINLIDTAPAYGSSEERIGRALAGQRDDWVIATKAGEKFTAGRSTFDFSADAISRSVQRSLRRLRTDYLDVVLLHSDGRDEMLLESGALDALVRLKERGDVRAIGISTKTVAGGMAALPQVDVLMVPYSRAFAEHGPVIAAAFALGKGILIKKALDSGHLAAVDAADAVPKGIQFALHTPGVSSVVLGSANPAHIRGWVLAAA